MREANTQTKSRWNRHLNWISSHINKLWSPFQSTPTGFTQDPLTPKLEGKRQPLDKPNTLTKMDPKMRVLHKMRQGNLDQGFEQKIKRVNKYFIKAQDNSEKPCDLLCPVCLQFLVKPVITVCGHNFCVKCLDQTLLFKPECPSCRHYLRGTKLINCETLHKLIVRSVQKYSAQQIQFYNQCLKESIDWLQDRMLPIEEIQIDKKVDAKDTQFIWCRATIKEIYKKAGSIQSVLIHYEGWNQIYDEVIDITSDRLAREGFYTSRLDIPHYKNLNNEEERMYSYVVSHENEAMINGEENNVWVNSPLDYIFGTDLLTGYGQSAMFQLPSIEQSSLQSSSELQGERSGQDSLQQSQVSQSYSEEESSLPEQQEEQHQQLEQQQENESNTSQISRGDKLNELDENIAGTGIKSSVGISKSVGDWLEIQSYNVNISLYTATPTHTKKEEQKEEKEEQQRKDEAYTDPQIQLSFDSIINNSSLWVYGKDTPSKLPGKAEKPEEVFNPEKEESLI